MLHEHCRQLGADELNRKLDGFGYPTIQLQLHHMIGSERYWLGVLEGRMDVEDDNADYPTIDSLEAFRVRIYEATRAYVKAASVEELDKARLMITWGNKEKLLRPCDVIVRTQTHIYQHQGQVLAMCRLLGKPRTGLDYPLG